MQRSSNALDGVLNKLEMVQNTAKAETVLNLKGPGSRLLARPLRGSSPFRAAVEKRATWVHIYIGTVPLNQSAVDALKQHDVLGMITVHFGSMLWILGLKCWFSDVWWCKHFYRALLHGVFPAHSYRRWMHSLLVCCGSYSKGARVSRRMNHLAQ